VRSVASYAPGMDTPRPRLDLLAFALSLAVLAWPAINFVSERNGAASIMCAICFAGLVAGWIVRVPGTVLLAVAFGLTAVLWMVWVDPLASARKTSALAHAMGGFVVGWACVETLLRRVRNLLSVAILALSLVIVLTVLWEVGEYVGDRLLDTALIPRKRDSAEDIFFGTLGGSLGIAFAIVVSRWRRGASL
jgi:predicted outer membrane lipoprotein